MRWSAAADQSGGDVLRGEEDHRYAEIGDDKIEQVGRWTLEKTPRLRWPVVAAGKRKSPPKIKQHRAEAGAMPVCALA